MGKNEAIGGLIGQEAVRFDENGIGVNSKGMVRYRRNKELETELHHKRYIGKVWESNNYGKYIILGVFDKNKYNHRRFICRFIKTGYERLAYAASINKGKIMDNYKKIYYNRGYIGDYEGSVNKHPMYNTWRGILRRCFNAEHLIKYPSYRGTTISGRWLNFTNFINDMIYIKGYDERCRYGDSIDFQLDKDTLVYGNKHYSLENCCFIPHKINSFLINIQRTNTSGVVGVKYEPSFKKWVASIKINGETINLGSYDNIIDACNAYYRNKLSALTNMLENEYSFIQEDIKVCLYRNFKYQYVETLNTAIGISRGDDNK